VPNAPRASQLRLLEVQRVDSALDRVTHRRRTLPEAAAVAAVSAELAEKQAERVRARTVVADLGRAQRKADGDVEQVRSRVERDRQRLDAGRGSPRELEGLSHELESLARRQSDLEDVELEVMEQLETAAADAERLDQEGAGLDGQAERAREQLAAVGADLDDEQRRLAVERATVAGGVDAALLELYDKIRATPHAGGVGAAAFRDGHCEGCRVDLGAQELHRLRNLPVDAVVRCEDCRRILVRVES